MCPHSYDTVLSDITPVFFFFNHTATTEIYTLSLHDALPISPSPPAAARSRESSRIASKRTRRRRRDRKSTRLNSSHLGISYAVFCLKKKNPGPHLPEHCGEAFSTVH